MSAPTEAPTEPSTEAVELELQVEVRVKRDESSNWTLCHHGENITHYVNVSGTKGEKNWKIHSKRKISGNLNFGQLLVRNFNGL